MLHISLAAEKLTTLFGFLPVTNSLLTTWVVMVFLIILSFLVTRNLNKRKPSGFQILIETVIGGLYSFFKKILSEKIDTYFPLLATIFLLVIMSNWFGLLPGVGSIGIKEEEPIATHEEAVTEMTGQTEDLLFEESESHAAVTVEEEEHALIIPLFRAPTADLNLTLALAITAVVIVQYAGLSSLGFAYLKKFFNFNNPIMTFVGLLEIISELAKVISFAFRLFGNIFAGEVLLAVVGFLIPFIAPLPFLGLEIFVGFIQALVFAMLTAVFLSMATHEH